MLLRVPTRLALLVSITAAGYTGVVIAKGIGLFSLTACQRMRNAVFRFWARGLCRIVGMRIKVEGPPPRGRFLLVSNHVSYLDIPLLAAYVDAAFVGKADLRSWPFLGVVFAAADTIFIDRARKRDVLRVMQRVETYLDSELGVIIFPEGTSGKGDTILPFKASLLELATQHALPVTYATLSYKTNGKETAQESICWWGDAPFLPHALNLLRLPSFEATLRFGDVPLTDPDRKLLAFRLRQAMLEHFTAMD